MISASGEVEEFDTVSQTLLSSFVRLVTIPASPSMFSQFFSISLVAPSNRLIVYLDFSSILCLISFIVSSSRFVMLGLGFILFWRERERADSTSISCFVTFYWRLSIMTPLALTSSSKLPNLFWLDSSIVDKYRSFCWCPSCSSILAFKAESFYS